VVAAPSSSQDSQALSIGGISRRRGDDMGWTCRSRAAPTAGRSPSRPRDGRTTAGVRGDSDRAHARPANASTLEAMRLTGPLHGMTTDRDSEGKSMAGLIDLVTGRHRQVLDRPSRSLWWPTAINGYASLFTRAAVPRGDIFWRYGKGEPRLAERSEIRLPRMWSAVERRPRASRNTHRPVPSLRW